MVSEWFLGRFGRNFRLFVATILVVMTIFTPQGKTAESVVNSSQNQGRALQKTFKKLPNNASKSGMKKRVKKYCFFLEFEVHVKPLWGAKNVQK